MDHSPWLEVKRRYAARVRRFEELHLLGSRWISFRRINEWFEKRPSEFPSYAQMAAAILAGKFEVNGRSQILFLWTDNVLIGRGARGTTARPAFRFTVKEYRAASHQAPSVLEAEYLSRFWIPRTVCARWFQGEGYPLPPWLQTVGAKPITQVKISAPSTEVDAKPDDVMYREWIAGHEGQTPPSRNADRDYLRAHFPNITQARIRALRRDLAPPSWKSHGRRPGTAAKK